MLSTFLEAMTQEQGLLKWPLIGHMAGHCRNCVYLVRSCHTSSVLTLQPLQKGFVTFPLIISEIIVFKKMLFKT